MSRIESDNEFNRMVRNTALWTIGTAVVIWLLFGFIPVLIYGYPEHASSFGDSFGFANSLLSSLALAGAICAIVLQIRELRYQREELQESQDTWKSQSRAMLLSAMVQAFQASKKNAAGVQDPFIDQLMLSISLELRSKSAEKIRQLCETAQQLINDMEKELEMPSPDLDKLKTDSNELRTQFETLSEQDGIYYMKTPLIKLCSAFLTPPRTIHEDYGSRPYFYRELIGSSQRVVDEIYQHLDQENSG